MRKSKYSKAKAIALIVSTLLLLFGTALFCSVELSMNPLPTLLVTMVVLCLIILLIPDNWVREYVK